MKVMETERLILRGWDIDDVNDLYEYAKNPNVGPHAGWKPHASKTESLEIIQSLFLEKYDSWAIVLKETGRIIGSIGYERDVRRPNTNSRELGYALGEPFWGNGIMTEAAKAALAYGFSEMKLDLIAIYRNPHNLRSARVIEKCGFIHEGLLRKAYRIYDGSIRDVECYSMTKEEYEEIKRRYHEARNKK